MNKKDAKNKHLREELTVTEITPKSLRCVAGPCPAIFQTNKNSFIIIGRVLDEQEVKQLLHGKVNMKEKAVEIPQDLLRKLFDKTD